jgi:hypothetical protein
MAALAAANDVKQPSSGGSTPEAVEVVERPVNRRPAIEVTDVGKDCKKKKE